MRIIILTYESFESVLILEEILKNQKQYQVICVVKSTIAVYKKSFLGIIHMVLKGVSIHFILFKIVQNLLWNINYLINRDTCRVKPIGYLKNKYNFLQYNTHDINDEKSINYIKRLNPDLIISVYFNQKIGGEILKQSKIKPLNIHPAYLPSYRGLFPYFWVLKNNEKYTGVAIHEMTKDFDNGSMLKKQKIPITKSDTAFSLNLRCSIIGAKLLVQTLSGIIKGKIIKEKQDSTKSSYYSWPKNQDYDKFTKTGRKLFSLREFWTLCSDTRSL